MLLEFKDVDTYYGDLYVLKKVNYTINEGEIVSLLGGNASGKSTTMKTIMGVVRPVSGTVIYQGEAIERMAKEVKAAMQLPAIKTAWEKNGSDVPDVSGAEFSKLVASEVERWRKVVADGGVKLE